MVTGGVLIIIGSWVRYGAAQLDDNRFVVMLIGQAILGLAQPFALSAPVTYADMWFPPAGRVTATALATLANPAGAAASFHISYSHDTLLTTIRLGK